MVKKTLTVLAGVALARALRAQANLPVSWQRLLARGEWQPARKSAHASLLQQMGQAEGVSLAALAWQGEALPPVAGSVLHADPVCLVPNREHLTMMPATVLSITLAEAGELVDALNVHFATDGLRFEYTGPDSWFVHFDGEPGIRSVPLMQAVGRNLQDLLWQGERRGQWHGWWNEIQMLLHSHPVNQRREAQGLPVINGVWFWGEGAAPRVQIIENTKLISDSMIGRGLAQLAGVTIITPGGDYASLVEALAAGGEDQAVLDLVDETGTDLEGLGKALIRWLSNGKARTLQLLIEDMGEYDITSSMMKKFWRRRVQGMEEQEMSHDA